MRRLPRALAAAILSCLLVFATRASSEDKTVLVFRLELARARFIAGENVTLKVILENKGPRPVSIPHPEVTINPQPVYTLVSPRAPRGETFALSTVGDHGHGPTDDPVLLEIAAGSTWVGRIPFADIAPIGSPGDYRLRAKLEWSGVVADSNEVAFTIVPLQFADLGFGVGARPDGFSEIFAGGLVRDPAAGADAPSSVLLLRFSGSGHAGDPLAKESMAVIATASATAQDVASPAARHLRMPDLFDWTVWREKRELVALSAWGGEPSRFELPEDGSILRPPLMSPEHALDVFALAGSWLLRVRFGDPLTGAPRSGSLIGARELPFRPASGVCGFEAGSERRHVALVGRDEKQVSLLHVSFSGDAVPRLDRLDLEGLDLLADAPPAVIASATDTRVLLVAVAREGAEPREVVLVEATFPADPTVRPSESRRSFALGGGVTAARVGYAPRGHRQDAFVKTDDGRLHALGGRVLRGRLDPDLPLVILVLNQASFILERDPRRGLTLTML